MSGEIVTLETREGKNPGEAVASYGRCIVFLPSGTPVNKTVRVELEEITTKKDGRGRTMYRGKPAPPLYTERWKDLGNGMIGLVTIATDWLFNESEEGVRDERPIQERNGTPFYRRTYTLVWGADLSSSILEEHQIRVTPLEREKVSFRGELAWEKTGEREEAIPIASVQLTKLVVQDRGDWYFHRLDPVYDPAWKVGLSVRYLPAWYQTELESAYPPCPCGRKRRDLQVWDSYPKCETCRHEETCGRCGKDCSGWGDTREGKDPWWIQGRMICGNCLRYEKAEQIIAEKFQMEKRLEVADMAKLLLSVDALPREAGEVILASTLDHLESEWDRDHLVKEWKDFAFYYFTEKCVFGSKFSPAALTVLQFLPQAVGNQLVELVAWLGGYVRVGDCEKKGDFYYDSQVKGKSEVELPSLTEHDFMAEKSLAIRLRGSEAGRLAALGGYQNLVEKLGKDSEQARAVAGILQAKKQDYAAALEKIREREEILSEAESGRILLNFSGHFRWMGDNEQSDLWVIGPDGEEVEPSGTDYRKRYTSEGVKRWEMVGPEMLALRWSRWQVDNRFDESWEVVKLPASGITGIQTIKARELEPHERFRGEGPGFDLSYVGHVTIHVSREEMEDPIRSFKPASGEEETTVWPCEVYGWDPEIVGDDYDPDFNGWCYSSTSPEVTKRRKAIKAAEEEIGQLEWALRDLERSRNETATEVDQAEAAAIERLSSAYGLMPVEDGAAFEVTFITGEQGSRDESNFIAGPFFDEASGTWVKLIADPYTRTQAKTGVRCYARVRAKNSTQLHLFEYQGNNPEGPNGRGGRKVRIYGYFAIPIYGPQDYEEEIAKTRLELATARQKLEEIKAFPIPSGTRKAKPEKPPFYTEGGEEGETSMSAG